MAGLLLSRQISKSDRVDEYDFLFRRPSAIRASQFEESILAIASSMNEADFRISTCQGIHVALQNVLKAESFLFIHDNLKYTSSSGDIRYLPKTGIIWKAIRQRKSEIVRETKGISEICQLLGVDVENVEGRLILLEPVNNPIEMRAVALMIAICDEPNQKQSEQFQWLTKNVQVAADRIIRLEKKNENQERMQGMLKVCGSLIDLDVSLLLLKIQTHIKQQLSCDSSVIMTIDESDDELVCMAFDESPLDEEIRLPISDCIYGSCILSGDILQIDNVSEDPRINPNIDFINGYEPYNILCVPIKCRRTSINTTLSVIGVAVAFNKKEGFNSHDQDNIGFIVKFSSSMLVNTLSFKHEIGLKQQNEALLSVAKSLFQKLNDTNTLLHSVMEQARDLTKAEKCSLFLVDKETQELVAVVFDSELPNKRNSKSFRIPIGQGIAGFVAQSGKTVNIRDAYRHPQFYKEVDKSTGFVTRNILCIPIIDHSGVVGVAELVNKKNGRFFTSYDEELAKSFSVYCGISIYHSMLYKKVSVEKSRSKLATELMLYHMQIPTDEEGALAKREVPSCEAFNGRMSELIFSPRSIPDVDTPLAVISMMKDMGLIQRWKIPRNKLAKFVLMVKKGYRNPPYHNWMHAFCVAHFSYTLFKQCNGLKCISELELLALFVSCLCHDIDHRGTNNAFQVSSNSVLASLYSSQGSVMERHHISQTMSILNTEDCDIFQNLTADEYRSILDLIYDIILATDLSLHLSIINELEKMSVEGYDSSNPHHHHLLRSLLMTSCDLSACLKDWDDSVAVSKLIYSEFFSQGDKEKEIGMTPSVMMDRDKAIHSEQQLNFLDKIAIPVYKLLSQLLPETTSAYENLLTNYENWKHWPSQD